MKGIPAKVPSVCSEHGDALEFKSIYIKPLEPAGK